PVSRPADSLFAHTVAAVVGRRRQSHRSSQLPPVLKLPPSEQFHHKEPTRSHSDSHQLLQPPPLFHCDLVLLRLHLFVPSWFYLADLRLDQLQTIILIMDPLLQLPWYRSLIPAAHPFQLL